MISAYYSSLTLNHFPFTYGIPAYSRFFSVCLTTSSWFLPKEFTLSALCSDIPILCHCIVGPFHHSRISLNIFSERSSLLTLFKIASACLPSPLSPQLHHSVFYSQYSAFLNLFIHSVLSAPPTRR